MKLVPVRPFLLLCGLLLASCITSAEARPSASDAAHVGDAADAGQAADVPPAPADGAEGAVTSDAGAAEVSEAGTPETPGAAATCPDVVQRSIVVCVDALAADDDFDDTSFFLIDQVLACSDPEPVASVWDGWCAMDPERPECSMGFASFVEEVLPMCVALARDEVFAGRCAFPPTWDELRTWPGLVPQGEWRIDRGALDTADDVLARQLVLAASFGVQQAHSVAEAFELSDHGVFDSLTLLEAGSQRRVHVLTSTFGENRYGRAFFEGTAFVVATVVDGDLFECAVETRPAAADTGDQ